MPNFDKTEINAIEADYQTRYKEAVEAAANEYLEWMKQHTRGIRFFTRWSHLYHGDEGKERVSELLTIIRNPGHQFFIIVSQVGHAMHASGHTRNSFKRYLYEKFTGNLARNHNPPFSGYEFKWKVEKEVREELSQNKATVSEYSFLTLTKKVNDMYQARVDALQAQSNLMNARARAGVNMYHGHHTHYHSYLQPDHQHHHHHPHHNGHGHS